MVNELGGRFGEGCRGEGTWFDAVVMGKARGKEQRAMACRVGRKDG